MRIFIISFFLLLLTGCGGSSSPTVDSLRIELSDSAVPLGDKATFSAVAIMSDQSESNVDPDSISIVVMPDTLLRVEGNTLISLAEGDATLTFTYREVSEQAAISILPPVPRELALSDTVVSLPLGLTYELQIRAQLSNGQLITVQPTAIIANTPGIISVENEAVLRAIGIGNTTIMVEAEGLSASLELTVTEALPVNLQAVVSEARVPLGERLSLAASATFTDNSIRDVTDNTQFTANNENVLIDGNTLFGNALGESVINATWADLEDSVVVEVTEAIPLALNLIKEQNTVPKGLRLTKIANARYSDGSIRNVTATATWVSKNTDIVRVTAAGELLAVAEGTASIHVEYRGFSDTVDITVTEAILTSLHVTPDTRFETYEGAVFNATASGLFSDGSRRDITQEVHWKSDDDTIATVSNHTTSAGQVRAIIPGETNIIASLSNKETSFLLVVNEAVLTSVEITTQPLANSTPAQPSLVTNTSHPLQEPSISLPVGRERQLFAIGTFENGQQADITQQVVWSVADPDIVSILNPAARPGMLRANRIGATIVTATTINNLKGTASLTVTEAVQDDLHIAFDRETPLVIGETEQLRAIATFSDGSTVDVTALSIWESSNPGIFTVSSEGNTHGLLRANAPGSARVSVSHAGQQTELNVQIINAVTAVRCSNVGFHPGCSSMPLPFTSVTSQTISIVPAPSEFEAFDRVRFTSQRNGLTVTDVRASGLGLEWSQRCRIEGVSLNQVLNAGEEIEVRFLTARTFGQSRSCSYVLQFDNNDSMRMSALATITTN